MAIVKPNREFQHSKQYMYLNHEETKQSEVKNENF